MSNVPLIDISEYLQKLLLVKASHELEPVRQLALNYKDILKHYPLAQQQMQWCLVPKAKRDYTAFVSKVSALVLKLKEFHIEYQNVRHWSEHWGTLPDWEAIQAKVALFHLPYEELNTLEEKHLQNNKTTEKERQEQERRQYLEERERQEQEKRQRQEAEERRLREIAAQNIKKELLTIVIFTSVILGMTRCVFIGNTKHKPTDFEPVVEAPTTESAVIVKEKKPEKIDNRASLESYLKGIKNGCMFNSNVAILTPVLEAVKVSTGPNENDYDYTLPPDNKMMEKYPDLYKSIPVVEVKQGYFEVSADINGKFYGLTASKLIRGYGNENGIGFFTLVFDSPDAGSILKKKINFKTVWHEIGRYELGVTFSVQNGKTHMTCDWSD